MKKLIIFLILTISSVEIFAQELTASTVFAVVKWNQTTINVGKVAQDQPVTVSFTVTNIGSVPLQITSVQRSYNCAIPEWPTRAIQPGASGVIQVVYDAQMGGYFNKVIKVTSNVEEGITELMLIGEVDSKANN